jgi:hypothetical protein
MTTKDHANTKGDYMQVRLTVDEKRGLRVMAAQQDRTVSSMIRRWVLDGYAKAMSAQADTERRDSLRDEFSKP